jgi:hypothetical protein
MTNEHLAPATSQRPCLCPVVAKPQSAGSLPARPSHSPAARVPNLCVYECPHRQVRAVRLLQPAWVPGRCRTSSDGDLARICCRITGTRLARGDTAIRTMLLAVGPLIILCRGGLRSVSSAGAGSRLRSAIFDPLTGRLCWLCCIGKCPGRTSWPAIGCMPLRGRSQRDWLFCGLSWSINTFEKIRLPVGTAGFEPATP